MVMNVGRLRRTLLFSAVAGVGVLACNVASAGAAVLTCGQTITQNTKLSADMTCPSTAINVGASNITLDLDGHTLTGPNIQAIGAGVNNVAAGYDNVTVTRGTIQGFGLGITMGSGGPGGPADGVVIDRVDLRNNNLAGVQVVGSNALIDQSTSTDNKPIPPATSSARGFALFGNNNTIDRSNADRNVTGALLVAGNGNTFMRGTANNNAGRGVDAE